MEKYIKRKTKISWEFISDVIDFTKNYESQEFLVNFEKVIKWLALSKDNLKETLISKFEKNFDYQINGDTDDIVLTPNCFKALCSIMQTTKSNEIRKNFIEIENLILKYKKNKNIHNNKIIEKFVYVLQPLDLDNRLQQTSSINIKNKITTDNINDLANDDEFSFIEILVNMVTTFVFIFILLLFYRFLSNSFQYILE